MVEYGLRPLEYLVNRTQTIDTLQQPLLLVVLQEWFRLLAVRNEALADYVGLVVGTTASREPLEQLVLRHIQFENHVQRGAFLREHPVQRLGLGDGAREAVQEIATAAVGLFEPLGAAICSGVPTLATCAGLVLAARQIIDPAPGQQSLGVLDVAVRRNALGPQVDSMETELATTRGRIRAAFIRAPVVTAVGVGVEVIARIGTQVVGVSTPTITGVAFHPELTGDATFHRHLVRAASGEAGARGREAVLSG